MWDSPTTSTVLFQALDDPGLVVFEYPRSPVSGFAPHVSRTGRLSSPSLKERRGAPTSEVRTGHTPAEKGDTVRDREYSCERQPKSQVGPLGPPRVELT